MDDTRSIDVAKTASIDMMSLNNKVVNMRPIIKRSKAQIVNRLCRHISSLKKKKGTDAQKEKNIRKAERLIEEIESIRRLKEDKVSKYSLANMTTFESISTSTLSTNMRALARLADHHLVKEVVNNFRQEHSDWRDLAAFLLVKQTGRKFKTKKQKQKKLAQRVENINASETMTKAYIEERFGKEGLLKAEERFQKKRKKGRGTIGDVKETRLSEIKKEPENSTETQSSNTISQEDITQEIIQDSEIQNNSSTLCKQKADKEIISKEKVNIVENKKEQLPISESKNASADYTIDNEDIAQESESKQKTGDSEGDDESEEESEDGSDGMEEEEDEELEESEENGNLDGGKEEDQKDLSEELSKGIKRKEEGISKKDTSISPTKPKNLGDKKLKSAECVVKKLNIGASSDESDEEEEEEEEEISVSNSSAATSEEESNLMSSESDDDNESESQQPIKKRKYDKKSKSKKNASVPEFLTKRDQVLKNTPNDPFFIGSDGEEEDDGNFTRDAELDFDMNADDQFENRDSWSSRETSKSMFYEPGNVNPSRRHFEKKNFSTSFGSRGRGRFERRGRGRIFERGRVDFRGRSRGGYGSSIRGRGRETRYDGERTAFKFGDGNSRGGNRRGAFSSRGSSQRGKGDFQKSFQRFGASSSKDSAPVSVGAEKSEKLHPSWEASRKRKAEQSGLKAFEGTKIVFDD